MNTILVPIDFSDSTPKVIDMARQIALALKSRMVILHVAEPEPEFIGFEPGPVTIRTAVAEDLHEERRKLEALKTELAAAGIDVTVLQIQGPTVDKILDEAQRQKAGLIVVGSHGRGFFYNLLVGGVCPGILKSATCPVLVVPAAKETEEI